MTITLEELHAKLTTEDPLERMRLEEAEMERRFPGYPPYLDEHSLRKIQAMVQEGTGDVMALMGRVFGYAGLRGAGPEMEDWLHATLAQLARSVAHEAASHMAIESARQAQRASHNMLMGTLAGIALGERDDTREDEEGEADARTEH